MSSSENSPQIPPAKHHSESMAENNSNSGFQQIHAHMLEKVLMKLDSQTKEQELYMSELRNFRGELSQIKLHIKNIDENLIKSSNESGDVHRLLDDIFKKVSGMNDFHDGNSDGNSSRPRGFSGTFQKLSSIDRDRHADGSPRNETPNPPMNQEVLDMLMVNGLMKQDNINNTHRKSSGDLGSETSNKYQRTGEFLPNNMPQLSGIGQLPVLTPGNNNFNQTPNFGQNQASQILNPQNRAPNHQNIANQQFRLNKRDATGASISPSPLFNVTANHDFSNIIEEMKSHINTCSAAHPCGLAQLGVDRPEIQRFIKEHVSNNRIPKNSPYRSIVATIFQYHKGNPPPSDKFVRGELIASHIPKETQTVVKKNLLEFVTCFRHALTLPHDNEDLSSTACWKLLVDRARDKQRQTPKVPGRIKQRATQVQNLMHFNSLTNPGSPINFQHLHSQASPTGLNLTNQSQIQTSLANATNTASHVQYLIQQLSNSKQPIQSTTNQTTNNNPLSSLRTIELIKQITGKTSVSPISADNISPMADSRNNSSEPGFNLNANNMLGLQKHENMLSSNNLIPSQTTGANAINNILNLQHNLQQQQTQNLATQMNEMKSNISSNNNNLPMPTNNNLLNNSANTLPMLQNSLQNLQNLQQSSQQSSSNNNNNLQISNNNNNSTVQLSQQQMQQNNSQSTNNAASNNSLNSNNITENNPDQVDVTSTQVKREFSSDNN